MLKVLEYIMKNDIAVVLDVDGTLGAYAFGDLCHSCGDDDYWEEYVKTQHPYDNISALPQMQTFVKDKAKAGGGLYVCSVSKDYERENKRNFILREYPEIPSENIIFVNDKSEKLEALKSIANKTGSEDKVAIVDDTTKTLDQIFENSKFITVHISTMFLYQH